MLAAVKAMLEERFNLNGVQTTTHCCAPLVVVSGPIVKALGFNTKEGAFGHGCRATGTIGRAVKIGAAVRRVGNEQTLDAPETVPACH